MEEKEDTGYPYKNVPFLISDKTLFRKAICQPAFSGLTPIHALIHCSSKKQSSQCWYSTIKVSNLPPCYSPRLLLKLFKSRYPSAYRAVMPVPESQWPQRTVRKKLAGGKRFFVQFEKKGDLKFFVSSIYLYIFVFQTEY